MQGSSGSLCDLMREQASPPQPWVIGARSATQVSFCPSIAGRVLCLLTTQRTMVIPRTHHYGYQQHIYRASRYSLRIRAITRNLIIRPSQNADYCSLASGGVQWVVAMSSLNVLGGVW